MSAAELEDHDRAYWVKTPYDGHADLQEWWPAIIYQNTIEALSFIKDTKVCAQLFLDQWTSGLNERRVALLLGDIDESLQNYIIIDDIDDESHVIPFFKGFGSFYSDSNASASLKSAMEEIKKRFNGAKESVSKPKEKEDEIEHLTNNNRVAKGGKTNNISKPKKIRANSQQLTPPPTQIVTDSKKPRRLPKDSDCSSFGSSFTPQKNVSTSINEEVQSLSSPGAAVQLISNGFSDTTDSMEDILTPRPPSSSFSSPSPMSSVKEDEAWNYTWNKLKANGWDWKKGSGLVNFYYLPPNGNIQGAENIDYFTSEQNVITFLIGKEEPAQSRTRTKKPPNVTTKKSTSKPKRVSKQHTMDTAQSIDDNGSSFSANPSAISSVKENDTWNIIWNKLKTKSWTYKKGSGLVNFYYLPPNGNTEGKKNVDYFTSEQDVMDFLIGEKEPAQSRIRTKNISEKSTKKNTKKAQKLPEPEEESVYSYYYDPTECSEEHHPGEVGPNDNWIDVWNTLKASQGWTYKTGGGNVSWYYIPPGGKGPSKNYSSIENKDYFVDEDKLKTYVMKTYGWKGDAIAPPVPKNFRLGTDFKETWGQLRLHGWKYNENNKTYVAPGKSSSSGLGSRRRGGGQEGKDFFKSKEDVVEFLKPFLKMARSTKKKNTIKKVKSKPKKKISATKTKRKPKQKQTVAISNESSSSDSDDSADETIVRLGEVIRDAEAWNILQRVFKFKYIDGQYHLPAIDPNRTKLANRDYFSCLQQLRQHLCSNGIPVSEGVDVDDLFYKKLVGMPVIGHGKMALVRYLAMTNVPLEDPKYIPDIEPLSDEDAISILERNCLERDVSGYLISFKLTLTNGVREFNKIEDLKTYICRSGFGHHSWSAETRLRISFWAADLLDIDFFDGRKEPIAIDLESIVEPSPAPEESYILIQSPGNVSVLQSPATSPSSKKKQVSEESERRHNHPENTLLSPVEQAKENMCNIVSKGGQPVLKDDEWINVLEKMKFTGWKHIIGKGLYTDRYILPTGSIKGSDKVDFVTSEYDAKCFAVENFGWNGDAKYAEEKNMRTLGTPSRKTRSPQPRIMTQSTPKKRHLYDEISKTTPSKRSRNISDHDESITNSNQTPQAKTIDSTEVSSLENSTPPTKQIVRAEPRCNKDTLSPITETAIVTEFKKDKPQVSATTNVQRNLSGAFDEQMPIGKKLNRCQILLRATYEMCSKNYYRKPNNVTSISGFLTGISQSIAIGQAPAAPKLLHILGPPGTGKTSAVRLCVRDLQQGNTLKKLNMVMWSAAAIRSSNDLFSKLCAQMGLNEYAGEDVIEKHLKAKNSLLVAVIDEVDLILHREARGLKEFFQWSYSPEFNFALILISNTYENQKLARLLPPGWDISSKQTVVFQAYDKNDLSNMLKLRINGPVFEDKALQYIATKTAAGGGDARRALSIASRSIAKYANMLSDEEKRDPFSSIISKERAAISFKYVRMAIKELDKGGCLESIDGLPPVAKIALSVMSALSVAPNAKKRIITRGMLIRNCSLVASHNIVNMLADIGSHWVTDVLDQLSDAGLLEVSGDNSDCHSPSDEKLKLCINPIDVEYSLEEAFPQKGYYSRIRTVIFNAL